MSFAKVKSAIQKKYPSVSVELIRGCIVLSGELDSWDDVYAAGALAVDRDSLGVINNIKLKGFTDTSISRPKDSDNSLDGGKPDVLVVGAGIMGAAVARELSKLKLNTWVVEKASDVAVHTSSKNDGCVHVGIDLKKGQQKLKYCHAGNRMFEQMCADLGVEFARNGQIIIFSKNWERSILAILIKLQAKNLGVWGVKQLSKKEFDEIEPSTPKWAKGAMLFKSGGVVSPYKLTIALAENAAQNGAKFFFDTIVEDMEVKDGVISSVKTNRGTIYPKLVINCAGVHSDTIAEMAGDRTFTIHPRKGTNLILDKKKVYYAKASVARSPYAKPPKAYRDTELGRIAHTKGGGIVRTIDNNILVGPNAIEQPYREDYTTCQSDIDAILKKHSLVCGALNRGDVITYFSGTRAATYEEDFVVRKGIFTKNIIEAAGIQSPGITAAPAIAVDIREWTKEMLNAEENKSFNPVRKKIPHLAAMKDAERDALIKKNPDYGEIICRCEEVSKGEIVDAINNPLGVVSIDAIKRRVRPGMGRCQGGFCSPLIIKLIAAQKNIPVEKVKKGEQGSEILYDSTKKPASSAQVINQKQKAAPSAKQNPPAAQKQAKGVTSAKQNSTAAEKQAKGTAKKAEKVGGEK
jgi:glycerol-3-phosphate dehydrogenase